MLVHWLGVHVNQLIFRSNWLYLSNLFFADNCDILKSWSLLRFYFFSLVVWNPKNLLLSSGLQPLSSLYTVDLLNVIEKPGYDLLD